MMKFLYNQMDGIIANSDYTLNDLLKYKIKPNKFCVIGNPVIDEVIAYQLIKEDAEDDWLGSDSHRVIISVGRLTEQKNHVILIKAFSQIVIENTDTRLIIIGEGDENRLDTLISMYNLHDVVKILPFQQIYISF